jgi:hypothetical protein
MKKATVILPESVWHRARLRVLDERTSLQKLMLRLLEDYLKTPKKETKG